MKEQVQTQRDFQFSNFQFAAVRCDQDILYPTVEHAFQASKTMDSAERHAIAALRSPADAKRAGRRVKLRADWNTARNSVMKALLRQKFAPGSSHARKLLATGSDAIVEWNRWHDNYWGHCTCERCTSKPHRNQLGQLLTQIRAELR